jgi:hypothetical protein
MQGTSLEEVFGSFESSSGSTGAPIDFYNSITPPSPSHRFLQRVRRPPGVDISGSTLFQIAEEQLFKGLTEEIPLLEESSLNLRATIDDYRNLKNTNNYILTELAIVEKNIEELEDAQLKINEATTKYRNAVLRNGVLTKEEYDALQGKQEELGQLQMNATTKCLTQYKQQALQLHTKLQTVTTQLSAYSDFIKTGVKEMVGSDVKPYSCTICFEKEISHCFIPCGHTFCEGCIKKSFTKKCMTCRADIQKTTKIFLGV